MKLADRMMLGLIAGLGANVFKLVIGKLGMKYKFSEIDGPGIAAGIFIPPYKLSETKGKAVGYLADATIAGLLGMSTVYALSLTGKNQALLKGLLMGQTMWQGFYGLMGAFGASQVRAYSPKSSLNEFVSHTVFGVMAAYIATTIGDERLFNGEIPLSASTPTRLWNRRKVQALPAGQSAVQEHGESVYPSH